MIDKDISFDETTIKILFSKYRVVILPIAIIFICTIIFFKVIIPQIEELSSMSNEVKAAREKISILRKNLNFLSNLDRDNQDTTLQNVSKALPMEKDFIGVLNAITNASINANVKLDDFSFAVGDLSTKSAQINTLPSLKLIVSINGGIDGARRFLDELSKSPPISDVQTVDIAYNSSTVTIAFYYKVVPPIKIDYVSPIKPISENERLLINRIMSWQTKTLNPSPASASSSSILEL